MYAVYLQSISHAQSVDTLLTCNVE